MHHKHTTKTAARLSVRVNRRNPNHHLWNNNGTWWIHLTLHRGRHKHRERLSLRTKNVEAARAARDEILANLERWLEAGEEVAG